MSQEATMRPNPARRSISRRPDARTESLEPRRLLAAINVLSSLNSSQILGPSNLIEDANNNLFFLATDGTTSQDAGLYQLPAGASSPTLLVSFPNQRGNIGALAFDIEGDLVGLANNGGANNDGFV